MARCSRLDPLLTATVSEVPSASAHHEPRTKHERGVQHMHWCASLSKHSAWSADVARERHDH